MKIKILFWVAMCLLPCVACAMHKDDQDEALPMQMRQQLEAMGLYLEDYQVEEILGQLKAKRENAFQEENASALFNTLRLDENWLSEVVLANQIKQCLKLCSNKNKTNICDHALVLRVFEATGIAELMFFYPLVTVTRLNNIKALKILLQEGCDINIVFPELKNNNLLYFARSVEAVKCLIEHKINVFHRNELNQLPFETLLLDDHKLLDLDLPAEDSLKLMVLACKSYAVPELKRIIGTIENDKKMKKKEKIKLKKVTYNLMRDVRSENCKQMGVVMLSRMNKFNDLVFE